MKKCAGCGAEFDDTSKYCPNCGAEYGEAAAAYQPSIAEEYGWHPERPKKAEKVINSDQGMIWHRVLLFFLIVNAIWSIITGIGYMNRYRDPEWIAFFKTVKGLQTYTVFCGVAQIAIWVFAITVYNRLRRYKKEGPSSLKVMYIICIIVPMVLQVWQGRILPQSKIDRLTLLDIMKNIMMLGINSTYYARRKNLFVN